ncbi:MAG: Mrp/NBP35 family ATP-binding protein [Actinobacteria bacterium]|nr:Mrp/NBP35 family ATP-binding protein [Actinomycetota bacterium]
MSADRVQAVIAALKTVLDPELHKDLVTLNMARDVQVAGDDVSMRVVLTTPACPLKGKIEGDVRAALARLGWVQNVAIAWDAEVRANTGFGQTGDLLPGVRNTIAIASGKGGVGKTTVAVNLAVALHTLGARVGVLDADIYGPNVPGMLGVEGRPFLQDDKIQPLFGYGLPVMSMGFLTEPGAAVIWRGPMIAQALRQLLQDVAWGELDYLVVDLPPGTGDAPLSLSQLLPLAGAVIVSTPQEVALQDVRRGIAMFEKLRVPVLGVVENMSYFLAPDTGVRYEIFDHGGGARAAEQFEVPFLGEIPLDTRIRIGSDNGQPVAALGPDDTLAAPYFAIAQRVAAEVSKLNAEKPEPLPVL